MLWRLGLVLCSISVNYCANAQQGHNKVVQKSLHGLAGKLYLIRNCFL